MAAFLVQLILKGDEKVAYLTCKILHPRQARAFANKKAQN